ncbi:MAG: hypothetical protein LUG85_01795 [Clostridiales bacterium]|nr:hypothetical protein [Clostridiales bacterium]
MKKYDVTLTGHYKKTIAVYAKSPEQAAEKVRIILCNTDLIDFSDEDFDYGEADIQEADEDRTAENRADDECENENIEDDCCWECPYFCPVRGECRLEDED